MHANPEHTERLLRWLDDQMTPAERASLEAELAGNSALRQELEVLKQTRSLLRSTSVEQADAALSPFFADRLMKRLSPTQAVPRPSMDEEFAALLGQWFRPVALVGMVLVLGLATYNVNLARDYQEESTVAESVFALPPVSSDAIYDLDYYSP